MGSSNNYFNRKEDLLLHNSMNIFEISSSYSFYTEEPLNQINENHHPIG